MESLKPLDMNSVMDIKFIKEMFSSIQARTSALCFQCTTCTNGCPVVLNFKPRPREELDLLPHQLMHAVRMGLKDLVLEARMLWACTECYNCTEGCLCQRPFRQWPYGGDHGVGEGGTGTPGAEWLR